MVPFWNHPKKVDLGGFQIQKIVKRELMKVFTNFGVVSCLLLLNLLVIYYIVRVHYHVKSIKILV